MTNKFYLIFTGLILSPLLIFDLIFDDKQELFMEVNHKIILGTMIIFLVWGIGMYLLHKKYRIVAK
jgi:hypothetical protein